MKAFFRKLANIKKRRIVNKVTGIIVTACTLKFGGMNSDNPPTSVNSDQYKYTERLNEEYISEKTETDDQSVNSRRFKIVTGSGTLLTVKTRGNQAPKTLKSTLEIRSGAGFTSMTQRHLKPHKINKRLFESDPKIQKEYNKLVKSNESLKKKFDALEKNLSQGHFGSGREKGFQQWSNKIYYVGSKGDGARIYYKFVPHEFEVDILAYSNKGKQTSITKRMERLYDN